MTIFKASKGVGRAAALLLVVTLLVLSLAGTVQADTAPVSQAQAETNALKALVDKLNNQLSAVDEEYNYANQQLLDTQARVKATSADLAKAEGQLDTARQQLSDRVVEIYKRGDGSAVEALLGSSSLTDLTQRVEQLKSISADDASVVNNCEQHREQVVAKKASLSKQLAQQQADATKTAEAKKTVESQLAAQKAQLQGKEVQLAQLQQQEKQQQAVLAAQAKAALLQAQAQTAPTQTTANRQVTKTTKVVTTSPAARRTSGSTRTTTRPTTSTPAGSTKSSTTGARVVSIAMQYLGVPYVWAGSSPSGFDCSGFAMYVYSKVGVSLPHSSAMQYGCGTHVSRSQLRPGDLVFFYSPIHHVGIYIGNGQMINARGSCVQIDSLWSSYVGATRIVN